MNVEIESSWKEQLADEFEKAYFKQLCDNVDRAYKQNQCFPPIDLVFNAFKLCPFHNVKVVIIGQDPYHGEGQAHGLSFSVNDGVPFPPSLQNIFKEIKNDLGTPIPTSGNLTRWAEQGVLLLNSILTVQANKPASHQRQGWETFTDAAIAQLNAGREGLVFMLWGVKARKKGRCIDSNKHLVLTSAHPSPRAVNFGCSFGKKHFSQANEDLRERGKSPINWSVITPIGH